MTPQGNRRLIVTIAFVAVLATVGARYPETFPGRAFIELSVLILAIFWRAWKAWKDQQEILKR